MAVDKFFLGWQINGSINVDFMGLDGKLAIVVGGGLGMGEDSTLYLARAGCDVAILDIDLDRATKVADRVSALGRRAFAIEVDVLDDDQLIERITQAVEKLGGIDIFVTVVGMAQWAPVLEMSVDHWERDHRLNLRYVYLAAQTAAKAMIAAGRPGAMTMVSSISGQTSAPMHSAYGAAKAGLINLAKSMAVELAKYGIRVNTVAPGAIKTPRIAAGPEIETQEKMMASSLVPFRRMGSTEDIAKAVLFLSSDMAAYITGQTLNVDGGWSAVFLLTPPES